MRITKVLMVVLMACIFGGMTPALADDLFEVKITSLTNTRGNAAMEVCGTAKHKDGKWPLVVTVSHDASFYSTLTSLEGRWCTLVKRWNFSGRVYAKAATFDGESSETSALSEQAE